MFHKVIKYIAFWIFFINLHIVQAEVSLDHAHCSIYVVNALTGEVLEDQNSQQSFIPASCLKLLTSGAALHLLGEDFRFQTHLQYDGYIDEAGYLRGNIYILGDGDPCLGSGRIASSLDWHQLLEKWVEQIRQLGIRGIKGKIIPDAEKWDLKMAVPSWEWEDLAWYYGAGPYALSFHENYYTLSIHPGTAVGDFAVLINTDVPLEGTRLFNEIRTTSVGGKQEIMISGAEYCPHRFLRGSIPLEGKPNTIKAAMENPGFVCASLLKRFLIKSGIPVEDKSFQIGVNRRSFYVHLSPTVGEIVHELNQKSINLYAENLTRKIGELIEYQGTTEAGVKAIEKFWKYQGIDSNGWNIADGSGLSRKNLITTKQLVSVLLKMKESKYFDVFFNSLPQHYEHVRAKSGFMSLVRGYAGYAGNLVFAIIINQCTDRKAINDKMDLFLSELNRQAE